LQKLAVIMQNTFRLLLISCFSVLAGHAQNVGIGTPIPDPSAKLEIRSSVSGLLMPRMTSTQRSAIPIPAKGLMVYDSSANALFYYDGNAWQSLSPGAGQSNLWSSDNTNNIFNSNTGNVGIGTNTPFSKLDVTTPDANWGWTHSNGAVRIGSFISSGGGWIATQSQSPLYFATSLLNGNTGAQMTLVPSGFLGIGTIYPQTQLDVTTPDASWGMTHSNGAVRVGSFISSGGGWFATQSNSPLYFATSLLNTNYSAQMTLTTNGNLGVGTLNPYSRLDIATPDASWGMTHSNGSVRMGTYVGSGGGWIATQTFSPLYFATSLLNGNNNAQMVLTTTGTLGIGTSSPDIVYLLYVNGATYSVGNVVSGNDLTALGNLYTSNSLFLLAPGNNSWQLFSEYNTTDYNLGLFYNGVSKGYFRPSDGGYVQVSDRSLKRDILSLSAVLPALLRLRPVRYHFKDAPDAPLSTGFIAQEVQKLFPELVSPTHTKSGAELLGLNYSGFSVLAVKAIQEQQVIIDDQQKDIRNLLAVTEKLRQQMERQAAALTELQQRVQRLETKH
jgi:hypothetical protein